MKVTKEDDCAFSIQETDNHRGAFGLTKREYFACHIMAAMQANPGARVHPGKENIFENSANLAVLATDALIAALNKPTESPS